MGGLRKVLCCVGTRGCPTDPSLSCHSRVPRSVGRRMNNSLSCLPASVMSELSSLHEDDRRYELRQGMGRLRGQAMSPIRDVEEESVRSSENRRLLPPTTWRDRYEDSPPRSHGRRPRSRSVDGLDDFERDSYPSRPRSRGQHGSDSEWHHRDYSPDSRYDSERYGRRRSRSRDDLRDLERTHYDNRLLEEAMRKKQRAGSREDLDHGSTSNGRSGHRKNRDEDSNGFPPPPPPYTETESVSSHSKDDRKLRRVRPKIEEKDPQL